MLLLLTTMMLHIFEVTETWLLPFITDSFDDIYDYSIMHKNTFIQVAKHGVCIYVRKDIEFQFIMVDCQNVVFIRLVRIRVFVIIVPRPP